LQENGHLNFQFRHRISVKSTIALYGKNMKRMLLIILSLCLLGVAVFAQSGKIVRPRKTSEVNPPVVTATPTKGDDQGEVIEDDGEVLKIDTTLVTIPVSVYDQSGRFIPGLRKNDFQIYEDGKVQQIEMFGTTEQPFTVALLIDVSRSTQFQIEEIQDAAIAFVDQLRPQDKVMVIAFDDDVQILSEFTTDKRQLRYAIRGTQFGNGTKLYDAVDFALNRRMNYQQGRKAIVLFTDGVDSTSRAANYSSTVRDAERGDVIIYPVRYDTSGSYNGGGGGISFPGGTIRLPFPWPGGNRGGNNRRGGGNGGGGGNGRGRGGNGGGGGGGQSPQDYALGERYLKELSDKSGGKYFNASTAAVLSTSFAGIADELRTQYSIGYYPVVEGKAGQRKQISVRVARANVNVKAKASYVVGEPDRDSGKVLPNRLAGRPGYLN
jgi:VWFA-related protein